MYSSVRKEDSNFSSDLARRNPFHPVASGSSLLKAAEILERRVHRVPVVDSQGKVVKIISQSAVVKFLHQNVRFICIDSWCADIAAERGR